MVCIVVCCSMIHCVTSVLHCVAVCHCELHCDTKCSSMLRYSPNCVAPSVTSCVAVCCSLLQCVTLYFSVVKCDIAWGSALQNVAVCCSLSHHVSVWCSARWRVAVLCSVLQFVVVCYTVPWLRTVFAVFHHVDSFGACYRPCKSPAIDSFGACYRPCNRATTVFSFWFVMPPHSYKTQLPQRRMQVVRSNKVARKRLTEPNGTPAMDCGCEEICKRSLVAGIHKRRIEQNSSNFTKEEKNKNSRTRENKCYPAARDAFGETNVIYRQLYCQSCKTLSVSVFVPVSLCVCAFCVLMYSRELHHSVIHMIFLFHGT